jgi:hypothetical protein
MKSHITPKKSARITQSGRAKVFVSKNTSSSISYADVVAYENSSVEFNFEVISPAMQIAERNSAYKFFSL